MWKWKWCCSVVSDSATPWTVAYLRPWNFPGKSTGVGCLFLLQGIFPTQGLNPGLPHCRQTFYRLSYLGSPLYIYTYIITYTYAHIHTYIYTYIIYIYVCFPHSSVGKESACSAGDASLIPRSGISTGKGLGYPLKYSWASLVAQLVENPTAMQETWVWSLGWEELLDKGTATSTSILAWRVPWTVESVGSQSRTRLGDCHFHFHIYVWPNHCAVHLKPIQHWESIILL